MTRALFPLALLLAAPALAQDPADIAARMDACMAGIDLDALAARSEAYAAAEDYQARVDQLCATGDAQAAAEYARGVEQAYYDSDPEAAKMHACLTEILGENADTTADEVCEP